MANKVGLISLGCPKNQVDAEILLSSLENAGYEIVDYLDGADVLIVNTCGFIDDAKKESIESILDAIQMKNDGITGAVVIAGCLSQLYKEEMAREFPEADAVIGIGANCDIVAVVEKVLGAEKVVSYPPREELPLCGTRLLTTPPYWTYLKIAEGCSNHCSYCVIPTIRGEFRSRKMDDILEEAERLAASGVKELVLIAQDTTAYGRDLYGSLKLPELLDRLSEIRGIEWLRLLYCYPENITEELLEVMASNRKVLHYLDLPLQHADDKILNAMNRPGSAAEIAALIQRIRDRIPDIALRTTFICGFPGEGDTEFENLAVFINETEFDHLGCFTFSPQAGTPAALLPDTVDDDTKAHRVELIMQDQYSIAELRREAQIGKTLRVLVEGYDHYSDSYFGRSYREAPDIDTQVRFTSELEHEEGDFVMVEIFGTAEDDLLGKATE